MPGSPNRSIEWRLKLFSVQSAIAELLLDLHALGIETEIFLRYYLHYIYIYIILLFTFFTDFGHLSLAAVIKAA
jgi:hypothetical protein